MTSLADHLRAQADDIDRAVSRDKDERDSGSYREIELMREAADALCVSEAMVWRDISNAPNDGTIVLLFDPDLAKPHRVQTAFWNDIIDGWQTSDASAPDVSPINWMPLPEPPK